VPLAAEDLTLADQTDKPKLPLVLGLGTRLMSCKLSVFTTLIVLDT
jgi:hypothetical protein